MPPDKRQTWKTAVRRAREAGSVIDGASIPVDNGSIVLLARHDDKGICKSLPATPVANPGEYAEQALLGALGAAQRAGRSVGSVHGLGTWKGNLDPQFEERPPTKRKVKYRFRSFPSRKALIRKAMDAGMNVYRTHSGIRVSERIPGAEERLVAQLHPISGGRDGQSPHWDDPDPF